MKVVFVSLIAAALASAASAQTLTPPDFMLAPNTATGVHQQVLGGGFAVTGFRVVATGAPTTGGAWQSDIEMTLSSPGGITIMVGPNDGTPPGNFAWNAAVLNPVGTPPPDSGLATNIDVLYQFPMGLVDGNWSVSFREAAGFGTVTWSNIQITPVPAPGSLALLGVAGLMATRRRR